MRGFLGGVSTGAIVALAGAAMVSLSVPLAPWGASPQNALEATAPVEGGSDTAGTPLEEGSQEPETQVQQETATLDPVAALNTVPDAEAVQDADLVNLAPNPLDDSAPLKDDSAEVEAKSATRPDIDLGTALAPLPDAGSSIVPERQNDLPSTVEVTDRNGAKPVSVPQADVLPDSAPEIATETASAPSVPLPSAGQDVPDLGDRDKITQDEAGGETVVPQIVQTQSTAISKGDDPVRVVAPDVVQPPQIAAVPVQDPAQQPVQEITAPDFEGNANTGKSVRSASLPQAGVNELVTRTPPGEPVLPLIKRNELQDNTRQEAVAKDTPFERNSVSARPLPGQPYMSIVLIEDASSAGGDALDGFPYPLTIAIDPTTANATKRMQDRRADGLEVMILADLPREGTPQDAEIALPIWFDRLPDTVGILEGVKTGVQGSRALADQVSEIVGDDGYGLVLQNNGLNTVQKLAARDGVPSGVVFRDFDGAGQDERAMRRFLDQAAFRARQEEAVIMVGRLKPDTISALLVWGLQDRASKVALVPVSASLKLLQTP